MPVPATPRAATEATGPALGSLSGRPASATGSVRTAAIASSPVTIASGGTPDR
jgi:hypothetical protein